MVCLYFILGSLVRLSLMQSYRQAPTIARIHCFRLVFAQPRLDHQNGFAPSKAGPFAGEAWDGARAGCAEPVSEGTSCCCR